MQNNSKKNDRASGEEKRRTWVWALLAAYIALMAIVAWQLLRDRSEPSPDPVGSPDTPTSARPLDGTTPKAAPPSTPSSLPSSKRTATADRASQNAGTPSSPTLPRPPPPPTFPERPLNRGPSAMTKELNAADKTITEDIDLLKEVFVSFRTGLKGGNPVGTNREITRALTGRNKMRLVWVDPAHPAINDAGELCDRWGTPFFFHQESAHAMGVRSAGPDQEMYTEDDALFEPPRRGPRQQEK